ncbi:MAG: DUF2931 family protein [Cloacibacterium sp.]|nr:DUF2931 family protein [Cloacibacterium sp.]
MFHNLIPISQKETSNLTRDLLIPHNLLYKIKYVLISILLISCKETKGQEHKDTADRFEWSAGISAPKFYPIGGVSVNFGYAAAGSITCFDAGWGIDYGSFVTGERYKPIPEEVFVKYISAVDNLEYKETIKLPKEKILQIFKENQKDFYKTHEFNPYDTFNSKIIVGMAPGGWIRVWVRGNNDFQLKEVFKGKIPGYEDKTIDERFRVKNFENWGNTYLYWQKHGVPYEAWAENEKEYDILYVYKENIKFKNLSYQTISQDGTYFYGADFIEYKDAEDTDYKAKLPVQMTFSWSDIKNKKEYDTFVVFPKNFEKIYTTPYYDTVSKTEQNYNKIELEIEESGNFGNVFLIGKNKRELLFRFKAVIAKSEVVGSGDYSPKVEYFIK